MGRIFFMENLSTAANYLGWCRMQQGLATMSALGCDFNRSTLSGVAFANLGYNSPFHIAAFVMVPCLILLLFVSRATRNEVH
jgi:hypothetical protein